VLKCDSLRGTTHLQATHSVMRCMSSMMLIVPLSFASALHGAVALKPPVELVDQFSISGIKVDATARSLRAARDLAIAHGLREAWSKLFRRFTVERAWGQEPQLADDQLLGLILNVDLSHERRNTTRYLADVVFHFNPAAVRGLLLVTQELAEPALVIPLIAGEVGFDPMSPWTIAWAEPSLQQSLALVVFKGDATDLSMPQDLTEMSWVTLAPMAKRYNARQVIFVITSEDAKTVDMIEFSASGKSASSLVFDQSTFRTIAKTIAKKAENEWRQSVQKTVAH
jgi:hypothetical protein